MVAGSKSSASPVTGSKQIVEDKRAPIPDQVATKMDAAAWFARCLDVEQIAKDLAFWLLDIGGCSKNGVTAVESANCGGHWKRRGQSFNTETVAVRDIE